MAEGSGLVVGKYFSASGNPYASETMAYSKREAVVKDDSGKVIEKVQGIVFPKFWSDNAVNTVTSKYFRKEGVPDTGREIDIRQLAGRVAKTIARWGERQGYFNSVQGKNLEEEVVAATIFQYGAFNSPVWFNLGLDLYGISQDGEGYHIEDGKATKVKNFYEHPQVSACFISSPEDSIESMVHTGALVSARVFKGGSGIGGSWHKVRSAGEPVSGGGSASGAKRFMDLQDSCARVIKSGGKTRRAATFQGIPVWHPDMRDVIRDKYKEEEKARILIKNGSSSYWESHTIQDLRGQNVNISVRCDDTFWRAYEDDEMYQIRAVKTGEIVKEERARKLAKFMAFCAHGCGDPGVQHHDIINKWNTCLNSGEIWASNPCSEYMFLDDSACNLASQNLMRFRKTDGSFDLESFDKSVDLFITCQDILVSYASYPTEEIALNSDRFRPLGLGFANLGAYIMSLGIPYDSDEARDLAAAIASNMTAEAYLQSSRLAEKIGPFAEFNKNKEPMMEVMEMHRKAARQINARNGLEGLVSGLRDAALKKWDQVIERGQVYGFRNAQTTLLAPTGTIGFMMDCDTTGCEPDMALKKYKELAGGGSMVIVNQTVPLALEKLGYDPEKARSIVDYIDKHGTVEGCKELKPEHLSVFDCSMQSGEGTRAIHPMGHIRMLGALQPHLSGAISKTVNCPELTSVEDIEEMFYQSWKMGVKAIAIYRDGSKASQPVRTKKSGLITILKRGEREHIPSFRSGIGQKVKIGSEGGTIPLFIRTGEYDDGRIGELFIDSLERGSEVNRLLNEVAIEFSEKIQYGVPLEEAIEIFNKAGKSQISGMTDHPFIKMARGPEGFIFDWLRVHYLGDVSSVQKNPEMRPLPGELRVYQQVPPLHLIPEVDGEKMYPGSPSLEETIKRISGSNYWKDEGLDTRQTIDKIKRTRIWKNDNTIDMESSGRMTGRICDKCGNLMVNDGSCWKCPSCKISTGGCGGG